MNVLGISGSLRKASFNTMLLKAAVKLAPEGMTIAIYERLRDMPPFDEDFEHDMPEPALDFKRRIEAADGLLIVSPEYNYGVPGVLKNAIDWASRPYGTATLDHKPIALMGAAPSGFGALRSLIAWRQTFQWTNSDVLTKPEVKLGRADQQFDADGELKDEALIKQVRAELGAFKDHIERGQHFSRYTVTPGA